MRTYIKTVQQNEVEKYSYLSNLMLTLYCSKNIIGTLFIFKYDLCKSTFGPRWRTKIDVEEALIMCKDTLGWGHLHVEKATTESIVFSNGGDLSMVVTARQWFLTRTRFETVPWSAIRKL